MSRGQKRKRKRDEVKSLFQPRKDSAYCTVKTSLKSIHRNNGYKEDLEEIVHRCNVIVTEAYHFIRMYCLHLYHEGETLPRLGLEFITYCIRAIGKRDTRGAKSMKDDLKTKLDAFYDEHFKNVLDHSDKLDLRISLSTWRFKCTLPSTTT